MGSFSIWHWLIVLVIVMLVFGTKKLRNIGADLGGAVRGFKDGMQGGATRRAERGRRQQVTGQTIEGEVKDKTKTLSACRGAARLRPRALRALRLAIPCSTSASPSCWSSAWSRWSSSGPRGCRRSRARSATCSAACSATSTTSRPTSTARWSSTSCASSRTECRADARSRIEKLGREEIEQDRGSSSTPPRASRRGDVRGAGRNRRESPRGRSRPRPPPLPDAARDHGDAKT